MTEREVDLCNFCMTFGMVLSTMRGMKRRTLFLDQGEMLGGAEWFMLDFFNEIGIADVRRIDPLIVGAKSDDYREKLPDIVPTRDFNWPSVRGNKLASTARLLGAARKLKMLAREEKATQIFANTPRTMFVAFLAKSIFGMKARVIVMMHDFTVPSALLRRILNVADVIVVNSIPTRRYACEHLDKSQEYKLRIAENGVDLKQVPEFHPVGKIENVLILGRIDPRKGQLFAVEAAAQLPEMKFRVVGSPFPGDARTMDYDTGIRDFVRRQNLENVEFVPEVSDPFLEMARADLVLALPTEPETFGRIVTEALACGRPVIAFDTTGPGDILRQFEKFAKVESLRVAMDTGELVKKIKWLAENRTPRRKITEKARPFVEKNYPLSATAKRLVAILAE